MPMHFLQAVSRLENSVVIKATRPIFENLYQSSLKTDSQKTFLPTGVALLSLEENLSSQLSFFEESGGGEVKPAVYQAFDILNQKFEGQGRGVVFLASQMDLSPKPFQNRAQKQQFFSSQFIHTV